MFLSNPQDYSKQTHQMFVIDVVKATLLKSQDYATERMTRVRKRRDSHHYCESDWSVASQGSCQDYHWTVRAV
jgi:hypothetical protein